MNKVLIALAAGLITMGAYAADGTTNTRAEVKAEASAAVANDQVAHGQLNPMLAKAQAKLSKEEMSALRDMVKAEAAAANEQGTIKMGEKPLK